jgi:hypothetical protein
MRAINIANEQRRDAKVGFEAKPKRNAVTMTLPDDREKQNVQFLKTRTSLDLLLEQFGDAAGVKNALCGGDPEIDIEMCGRFIKNTRRIYLTGKNKIAYSVNMAQISYDPAGKEMDRHELSKTPSNVATDMPIKWSGREFPREEVIRRFVFSKKYQLYHTSGITFDFLFNMAQYLASRDTMMFVGGGKKGNEPVILSAGGEPYRGFLEGRVDGATYCLIMHLSSLEMKSSMAAAEARQ